MPKRSHLLILTIAVDAMLLMGAMQAQAEDQEAEPPLIVQISEQPSASPGSDTLSQSTFSTLIPVYTPPK